MIAIMSPRISQLVAPEWLGDSVPLPREVLLATGQPAFLQGDETSAVFLVGWGRVRLRRTLEDGTTVAVHTAVAGGTFAEAAVSADRYHCDAIAEVSSSVWAYPIEPLRRRLAQDAAASLSFATFMANQVRYLRAQLELRNIRSAEKRVLAWLRMNAEGAPLITPKDQPWTEVAHEIGLSREVLYRTLADLERSGTIRRENDRTVLTLV